MSGPFGADVSPERPLYLRPTVADDGAPLARMMCGHCEEVLFEASHGSPETDLEDLTYLVTEHSKVCSDKPW